MSVIARLWACKTCWIAHRDSMSRRFRERSDKNRHVECHPAARLQSVRACPRRKRSSILPWPQFLLSPPFPIHSPPIMADLGEIVETWRVVSCAFCPQPNSHKRRRFNLTASETPENTPFAPSFTIPHSLTSRYGSFRRDCRGTVSRLLPQ